MKTTDFLTFVFEVAPHKLFVDTELQAPGVKLFISHYIYVDMCGNSASLEPGGTQT